MMSRLGHPLLLFMAMVWLVVETLSLTREPRSVTGRAFAGLFGRARPTGTRVPQSLLVVRDADGVFQVFDLDNQSTDELVRNLESPTDAFLLGVSEKRSEHLLAPVFRGETVDVFTRRVVDSSLVILSDDELEIIKHRAIQLLKSNNMNDEATLLQQLPIVHSELSEVGLLRNTMTYSALAVLALQPLCVPAWIRERRRRRADKALAAGRCPTCGYEKLRQDVCSECGTNSTKQKERR